MFGFIGRKARVAEAREALRAVLDRGGSKEEQLGSISPLAQRDDQIHVVSVRLLEAGNTDRVFMLFDTIAPAQGRGALFGWLWGTSHTRPAGSDKGPAPRKTEWSDLDMEARMVRLTQEIKEAIDDPASREPYHQTTLESRWRMLVDGRPYEIEVDDDGDAEVRVRHLNRRGYFSIRKGDAQLPRAGAGAWGDPLDLIQQPVGDDLWLVARRCFMEDDVATWQGLPAPCQTRVSQALQQGNLVQLHVNSPVIEAHASVAPVNGRSVPDQVRATLDLLAFVAETMSEGAELRPPRSSTVHGGQLVRPPAERVVCSYCGTEHFLDVDPRCPSCGAARQG